MKRLGFELSMPNRGSWNGKWSGEQNLYFKSRDVKDARADEILGGKAERNFHYSWGDGWGANVKVYLVCGKTSARLTRQSSGFCGYGWMIDSIIDYGKILNDAQIEALKPTIEHSETVKEI